MEWTTVALWALVLGALLLVGWLSGRLSRLSFSLIPVRGGGRGGHEWVHVSAFPAGRYCSVCETSSFHGAECAHCGIVADDNCVRPADRAIPCKALAAAPTASHGHHWVKGNLPPRSHCEVCEALAGDGPGLQDWRCVWCLRAVHDACRPSLGSVCDFGRLRRLTIPPASLKLRRVGWKGNRRFVVKELLPPPNVPDWRPLIVFANQKSGNGDGGQVLQAFRKLLNPAQVLDLSTAPPERGLEWCRLLRDSHIRCRILVAGGDGTVGWVLETLERLDIQPQPEVCILPLGTGNDLSRVVGWGPGHSGPLEPLEVLAALEAARPVCLDRWAVSLQTRAGPMELSRWRERTLTMSGYLSVGVDAQVTLNFHRQRFRLPSLLAGRLANKFLFFHYGTKDLMERGCGGLEGRLELWLDGVQTELPPMEGLVVQNIATWGAGVRPWELCWCGEGEAGHGAQAMDDGLLEVFALSSSFHIAQMQVGLAEPIRLGQAKDVLLRLNAPAPMQVDGEPWVEGPGTIRVGHKTRARLLANDSAPQEGLIAKSISALFNRSPSGASLN